MNGRMCVWVDGWMFGWMTSAKSAHVLSHLLDLEMLPTILPW